jgi:glucose/mannose-6-phosphate isomerase
MASENEQKVAASIVALPAQIRDVIAQAQRLVLPAGFGNINRVVVNGMGGSNLGARIVASVFKEDLAVPVLIEPGYEVPGYVDENTLYIISSYSGNTEEPLSTFYSAKKRGAKIVGLTCAGRKNKLAALLKKQGLPALIFNTEENPSGQPRLGLGYAIFALLALLDRAGVIKLDQKEISRIISILEKDNVRLDLAATGKRNPARIIAEKIYGREAVLVGAEFLEGNLHAWRNQFCETSKNFADYLVLSDMNHYALEGLTHPEINRKNLVFIFVESDLYRSRIKKRAALTREIVRKNSIDSVEVKLKSKTKLAQAAELLQLGSWVTLYLAQLNQVDPISIRWVDWFKKKLK